MRHLYILLSAALLSACARTESAVGVTVEVAQSTKAACVQLVIKGADGREHLTRPVQRDGTPFTAAIFQTPELGSEIRVRARGVMGPNCDATPVKVNEETAESPPIVFRSGKVERLALKLDTVPYDTDGDGFRSQVEGGPDCDDGALAIHPGVTENCSDGVDNNCSGAPDCNDASCISARCEQGFCLPSLQCGTPLDEIDCSDKQDDDKDGVIDCQEQSCGGRSCSDICATGGLCNIATKQCEGGVAVTCDSPPSVCHEPQGTCRAPAGCEYKLKSKGAACPGGHCSATGACLKSFPYTPSNFKAPSVAEASQWSIQPLRLNCPEAVLNTDSPMGSSWCGEPAPTMRHVTVAGGPLVLAVVVESLYVSPNTELRLVGGSTPVVFAVFGDATIEGFINAGSIPDSGAVGPGANKCADGDGSAGNSDVNRGGGGGAGGTFGSVGGRGSKSSTNRDGGYPANGPVGNATLTPLRAGCGGGHGGTLNGYGRGGPGGGALQISAAGSLTVSGTISAAGAGGGGGRKNSSGGGGGGSGGAVLLEAATLKLTSTSKVTANGGGGGEGHQTVFEGQNVDGDDGMNGRPGSSEPAYGGNGPQSVAGPGGDGAAGTDDATTPVNATAIPHIQSGGGGGGGGAGRIRLNASVACVLEDGVISPPASRGARCQ